MIRKKKKRNQNPTHQKDESNKDHRGNKLNRNVLKLGKKSLNQELFLKK